MVSKYLDVLISLGLIIAEKPFGAPEKFKRRLYWISDQYLKFWFRYILPHRSEIESSHSEEVLDSIMGDFASFAGEQFETLMKELVAEGILDRTFGTVSRWWGRNGTGKKGKDIEEIDIVAYSEARKELLFAECKWVNKPVPLSVVTDLRAKAETLIKQYPGKRYTYAVFSKSGFKGVLPKLDEDITLMDLSDIERKLYKK